MAIFNGTPGDDTLVGSALDDIITTFAGNDTVDAGAGDDLIIVDENGQGTIDGGAGFDTVQMNSDSWGYSYYDAFNAIAYLSTGIGQYTMTNVERVEGLNTSGGLNYLLLIGGAGADVLDASTEGVLSQLSIFGGDGNDTLIGASVYSDLNGGDGDDIITAGSGGGNFVGGAGADTITAGSGYDQLSYSNSAAGITIDLSGASAGVGGDAQGDILSGQFEYVSLSQYADTATGSTFADNIYAGEGDDTINGGDGDDIIAGDAGSDTLTGGNGNDTFQYYNYDFNTEMADTITDFAIGDRLQMQSGTINGNYITPIFIGTDAFNNVSGEMRYEKTGGQTLVHLDSNGDGIADQTLTLSNAEHDLIMVNMNGFSFDLVIDTSISGTSGADTLNGTPGDDIIYGLDGNDTITTLTGNDTIDGGGDDDLIIIDEGGQGSIDGGTGNDTVRLVSDTYGYSFYDIGNQTLQVYSSAGSYNVTNAERIEAENTNGDLTYLTLIGTAGADTLDVSGETILNQAAIYGGDGADTLTGASVYTQLNGGDGNDSLSAGSGGSELIGGLGADTIAAGSGYDTLSYTGSAAGVTVDLTGATAGAGGDAQGDILSGSFEGFLGSYLDDVVSGSAVNEELNGLSGADTLSGLGGNDSLFGNEGIDILSGGDGDDYLNGGNDSDTLTGGLGSDTFAFYEYENGAFSDTITDFDSVDEIRIDQGLISGTYITPTFIGAAAFSGVAGEMRFEKTGGQTLIHLDTNGDMSANETLTISNGEFDLVASNITSFSFDIIVDPTINGTSGNDTLMGTPGDDVINGLAGDDTITTFTGMDTIDAGDGDDLVIIDALTSGTVEGGLGYDTVQVSAPTSIFNASFTGDVNIAPGFGTSGGLTITNVERLESLEDGTGNLFRLWLVGESGADNIDLSSEVFAANGRATIATGAGDDYVTVGTNTAISTSIYQGDGNDTFIGGDNQNFVFGSAGADTITGGTGFDTVSYGLSVNGVTVDLDTGTASGGDAQGDVLSNIEGLNGSQTGSNTLTGNASDNQLTGGQLADVISGGAGNDFIVGGLDADTMTGGAGADIFFTFGNYEGGFTGTITDFEIGDTVAGTVNYQGPSGFFQVTWLGTGAFTGTVGELRYEKVGGQTLLHMDTSGDGLANETLTITNGEFDLVDYNDSVNNFGAFELRAPAVITPNLVTTIQDEIAEDTDLQTQGNDGIGLSLREAVAMANVTAGADVINYDANVLANVIVNTSANGTLVISDDLTLSAGVDIFYEAVGNVFDIQNGATVINNGNIFADNTVSAPYPSFGNGVLISSANATFSNNGSINTNAFGPANEDRSGSIIVEGQNVTVNNGVGASIVSQGRYAIYSFDFDDVTFDYVPDYLTVNNDGTLEAGDDTIRIGTGEINNTGTIRSTGQLDFGGIWTPPGLASDAIAIVNQLDAGFVPGPDGLLVVNNSATGLIEGFRSGIQMQGGGTVNNDGTITGNVVAILTGGFNDFSNIFVLNNSGTITAGTDDYGLNNPEFRGSIYVSSGLDSAVITNSGTINSGALGIYSLEGIDITNTATGQIIGDTDGSGDDDVSFYGTQLEDLLIEASISFPFAGSGAVYENTQGITVDANGDFVIPAVGTFPAQGSQVEVAFVGGDNPILPLVDIAATQTAGFLTFQSDVNGTLYPATINISSPYGTLTVDYVSGTGFTITDASGGPAYALDPATDYDDTIDNSGLMSGDVITGLGDDSIINRGDIVDDIYLGTGNDTYTAGAAGTSGDIYGGDGTDIINARGGDNTIYGEDGNDFLRGGEGNDILNGGFGVDYLRGGVGADQLLGYAGADWADYITSSAAVTVNLLTNTGLGGEAQGDTYFLVERVYGSNHDDNITGDNGVNYLRGAGGDDMLFGGAGGDYLQGDAGADALDGGAGADWAYYVSSSVGLTVDLGNTANNTGEAAGDTYISIENVFGSRYDDTLTGDASANFLRGFLGNDTLNGGAGDDFLRGDAGADVMDGGAGNDWLYYAASAGGVTIDLGAGTASGGHAAGDTFTNIERVFGSNSADTITGDGGINYLRGSGGNDALNGAGGTDFLQGDAGADALDGGAGTDWAYYVSAKTGVTVDLLNSSNNTGEAAGDTYVSIESVRGSSFNDVITGDAGTNYLIGGNGDDIITGGAGNDTLRGDAGADTFVFVYGTFRDKVIDYDDAENDMLDFSDFGFTDVNDALSNAADVNGDVVFTIGSDIITIENTTIIEITDNIIV